MENDEWTLNNPHFSQKSYRAIQTICKSLNTQDYECLGKTLNVMCELVCSLQLNDLEITVWGVYLKRFGWISYWNNSNALRFAAYAAKAVLNEKPEKLHEMRESCENAIGEYEN